MFSQTGQSDFYEFIQIRQSEISLADSPILTNFRHSRYCIHFWTKPSRSRSHFFYEKKSTKIDIITTVRFKKEKGRPQSVSLHDESVKAR